MPKYPTIPERLLEIDALLVSEHYHIDIEEDDCYFLWERISGATFQESATNDLIANLQIPVTASAGRLYWKATAINYSAGAIGPLLPNDWKASGTFVPIPPSKIRSHPEHDRRISRVLNATPGLKDVRELVIQTVNTIAKEKDISPEERAENYKIDEALAEPEPNHIIIFDDVVAGASHFKAMKMVLSDRFPNAEISGLFLARSIRPNVELIVEDVNLEVL